MPFVATANGVRVAVRLNTKASAARIDGVGMDGNSTARLRTRLTPAPERGKANSALMATLCTWTAGLGD